MQLRPCDIKTALWESLITALLWELSLAVTGKHLQGHNLLTFLFCDTYTCVSCTAACVQVDYIHTVELTRDNFCTVVGLPSMIADFKELFGKTEATLYYDTTFCLGDFYVSSLLYRSSIFVGSPVQPLMMMVHERRTTDSHELMFRWLRKLTGMLKLVIVADREQAITKAISNILPESKVVYCWNHILGDVRVCIKHFLLT